MNVSELVATLGLDLDERAFSRGTQALMGLRAGVMGIAAAAAGAFVGVGAMVTSVSAATGRVRDLSTTAGQSTQAFQELAYAANSIGMSTESFGTRMVMLSRRMRDAAGGNEQLSSAFRKLGVSVTNADGTLRTSDAVLRDLADAFSKIPPSAARTALGMTVLGETGVKLLPVLENGAAGLDKLAAEAHKLGVVFDGETLAAGARFDDNMRRVGQAAIGVRNAIGGPLLDTFADLAEALAGVIVSSRDLIAVPIVSAFKGVASVLRTVTEHFWIVRFALLTLAGAWAVHLAAVAANTAGLGFTITMYGALMVAAVKSALAAAAAWVAAAAPFIALGALIALLVDELWTFAAGGDSVFGRLIKWLDRFDPDANPLIELLRSAGSLLFDLTDPKKWDRLLDAIKRVGEHLTKWILDPANGIMNLLQFLPGGQALKFGAGVLNRSGVFSSAATTPTGTVQTSTSSSTSNHVQTDARSMDAQINVTMGPGASTGDVGTEVERALRNLWENDLEASFVAVGQ